MHDLLNSAEQTPTSAGDQPWLKKRQWWLLTSACVFVVIIALFDFNKSVDINVAFFYCGGILACAWTRSRRSLVLATAVCVGLTLLAAALGPSRTLVWPVIWVNRISTALSLAAIALLSDGWITRQAAIEERSTLIRNLARTFDLAQAIVREPSGKILFWSKGAQRLYGWTGEEAVGKMSHELLRTEFPQPFNELGEFMRRNSRWTGQLRHFKKTGEEVWVASHWSLGTGVADYVPVVIEVNNEITELKRSERALAVSEQRFRRISESDVIGIILADADRVHEANGHFLTMLGYTYDEVSGMAWNELIPPEHIEKNLAAFRLLRESGAAPPFETELLAKDRTHVPVLIGSVDMGGQSLSFVIDQTEQKRLQTQLVRAQKLESIGKLAGGIAHDFNNLLTIIIGHVQLLLDGPKERSLIEDSLQEISGAADRAADLTKQLLTFSRHQPTEIRNVALNDFIRGIESMLSRLITENIGMEVVLDPRTGTIQANVSQLEQVLFNLVVNARDAMPNGGKLHIETARVFSGSEYVDSHVGVKPGHYVMLVIGDSGVGMPEEIKSHIFEPFFTTKEPGKGTGLGLATVYGIVTKMGGSISLYSEPNEGTVFKLLFPAVAEAADVLPTAASDASMLGGGDGTILVAEDEAGVRAYIQQVLSKCGYRVLAARNGREALDMATTYKGMIDLLLTDTVMPEMGGEELAGRLQELRPGTPILRMTGYTDRIWRDSHGDALAIQKPFTPRTLLQAVRQLVAVRCCL